MRLVVDGWRIIDDWKPNEKASGAGELKKIVRKKQINAVGLPGNEILLSHSW